MELVISYYAMHFVSMPVLISSQITDGVIFIQRQVFIGLVCDQSQASCFVTWCEGVLVSYNVMGVMTCC